MEIWNPNIAFGKFYKICKFENNVTRNDVIMMSVPKQWKNADVLGTSWGPVKLYIIRKVLMRAFKKCKFYFLSIFVKSYGHLSEILAFLPQALTKYG